MAKQKQAEKRAATRWVLGVFLSSFALSMAMSWSSSAALAGAGILLATLTVILLVAVGILFDILGVAVTSADRTPFVAMAAKKVKGARQALWMLKNADKVSSVCNDVVGDICGVVSGAAGATLALRLMQMAKLTTDFYLGILVSGFIAALTVGGKAFGKRVAIRSSRNIVLAVGRIAALVRQ